MSTANTNTTNTATGGRRPVKIPHVGKFRLSMCDQPLEEGVYQHPREIERLARQGASFLNKLIKSLEEDKGPGSGRKLSVPERKLMEHTSVTLVFGRGVEHVVHMAPCAPKVTWSGGQPLEVPGKTRKEAAIRAAQRAMNTLRDKVVPFARWARDYLAVGQKAGAPPVHPGKDMRQVILPLFGPGWINVVKKALSPETAPVSVEEPVEA